MDAEYTLEIVMESIRGAFTPLECVVEEQDFRQKVGFRVYGPQGESLLTMDRVVLKHLNDRNGLSAVVNGARDRIQSMGHKLGPWQPPSDRVSSRGHR